MSTFRLSLLALGLLAAAACNPTKVTEQELVAPDAGPDNTVKYPPAPYGTRPASGDTKGDTIEDISLYGYKDADTKWGTVRLADFYDPDDEKGYKLLIVEVGARWCIWCKTEAATLSTKCDENYNKGVVCYSAVFQDEKGDPAEQVDVDAWRHDYDLKGAVVQDKAFKWGRFFDAAASPLTMYINPRTMEILQIDLGYSEASIDKAIADFAK